MSNIIFSANVVLPLLVLMAVGYFIRLKSLLDIKAISQCNTLVFKLFLPVLLFNNVRSSSIGELGGIGLFLFVIVFIILSFIIATVVIMMIEKDNAKRGVMIQGIARSNYALFGIPLVGLLFPDGNLAIASILVALVIPMFNILSVVVLTCFGSKNTDIKSILLSIVKNPLIIGTFLGIICLLIQIEFPQFIEQSLTNVGSVATPFSLMMLGAGFEFQSVGTQIKRIGIVVLGKLVIVPAIILTIAVFMGFSGIELACLLVIFASPTAVSSFTMAKTMGGDSELAASIVVFTSTLCIFTMFLAIFVLKSLQLL